MDSQKCTKHPSQTLRYVCVTCGNIILCRDCKSARHASHVTRDVRDVADELRQKAQKVRAVVDERLDYVKRMRASVEEHIASFEAQVEKAEREMEKRQRAVLEWAHRHHIVAHRRVQELKQEGLQELKAVLVELDAANDSLRSLKNNAVAVVRGSKSDSTVVSLAAGTDFGAALSKSQLSALVPQNTFRLVTRAASPDRCQREIELYIGEPELAEVGTAANLLPMCAVPRFNCSSSSDSPCQVMALLPMQSGTVSVAYQDDKDAKEGFTQIATFTKEGHRQFRGGVRMQHVSKMIELSPTSLMLLAGGNCNVCKVLSLGKEEAASPLTNNGAVCLLEHNGVTKACTLKLKNSCSDIEAGNLPALTPVLALDVPDPMAIATNKNGEYFVVLTDSRRIVLYQRDNPVALWKSNIDYELKNLSPTAVCFYAVDKKEKLMVADFRYNSVLVVDYLDGGKIVSAFHSPRPSPSALAVDGSGFLWIGCQSGEVVSCFPLSTVEDQAPDDLPTDEAGYLSPAIAIYEDILSFSDLRRRATVVKSSLPVKPDEVKVVKGGQGSRMSDVVSQTVVLSLVAPDNQSYTRMGPPTDKRTEPRVVDLASFVPENSSEPWDPAPSPPPTPSRTVQPKAQDTSSTVQSKRQDAPSTVRSKAQDALATVQPKTREVMASTAQLKDQDVAATELPRTRRPVPVPRSVSSSSMATSLSSEEPSSSSTLPRTLSSSSATSPSSSRSLASPFSSSSQSATTLPHSSSTSLLSSSPLTSPSSSSLSAAAAAASSIKAGDVKDSQAKGNRSYPLSSPHSIPFGSRSEEAIYVNISPDSARGFDPSPLPPPLVPRGPSSALRRPSQVLDEAEAKAGEEPARDRPSQTRRGPPPSPGRPPPAATAASPLPHPSPAGSVEDPYVDAGSGAPSLPPRACGPPVVRVAPLVASSSSSSSIGEKTKATSAGAVRR